MTHFIIDEDKDENWKNSEVMRIFAEFVKEKENDMAPSTEAITEVIEAEVENESLEVESDIDLELAKVSLEIALDGLNKIASESVKYGNEKATYKIELAASQLKDLIDRLDKGDL